MFLSLDVLVGENSHSDALSEQQRALNIQHYWFDYNGGFMESLYTSEIICYGLKSLLVYLKEFEQQVISQRMPEIWIALKAKQILYVSDPPLIPP